MKHRIIPDLARVAVMLAAGAALLFGSLPLARWLGEPLIASLGLWLGVVPIGGALVHMQRRGFFPYVDMRFYADLARLHPIGAGLVWLGVCFVIGCGLLGVAVTARAAEPAPADVVMLQRAAPYLQVLAEEQRTWWPGAPAPFVFAGQVEQESFWRPAARLRTAREEGAGFSQITRTDRFDALAELRAQFPGAFRTWGWGDTLLDPRLQLRAVVLKDYGAWRVTLGAADERERMAMMLAAYNGGQGGLAGDRRLCAATPGCDPARWFGHVERTTRKATHVAAGYGESFGCTNHRYPGRVAARAVKYAAALPTGSGFPPSPNGTAHLGCKA